MTHTHTHTHTHTLKMATIIDTIKVHVLQKMQPYAIHLNKMLLTAVLTLYFYIFMLYLYTLKF